MRILTKEEFQKQKDQIKTDMEEASPVFIYPTDTIYGIGCNAMDEKAVEKVRELKEREGNPFSIIVPSKEWIDENCYVNDNARDWIKRLPGPYTLVLKLKNRCIAKNVAPGMDTVGIRIPEHWISKVISEIEIPILSTSVNKSGEDFMTSLDDVNEDIKSKVDFIVYEGLKDGRPSKLIDLTDEEKVVER